MKKRNAFTLVELLAIIAILGVIAILVLPNINSNSKKEKEYDKIVTTIKSAAKLYHINNKNATKVYISTLISDEYLSSGIINPITDDVITGCVVISKNANDIKEYEYINNISDCDVIALQYTLTVVINEGSLSQTFEDGYASGAEIILQNPTKTGSVFTGWAVSGAGSNLSGTTLTIGTEDTTITANWLTYSGMYTYTGSSTIIDDDSGNWRIKLLTSGTFTPLVNMTIDAFLVGGGGGGGAGGGLGVRNSGGGGGYTATYYSLPLVAETNYAIIVGAGGVGGGSGSGGTGVHDGSGLSGGVSSAFGYSINGGQGGSGYTDNYGGGAGGSGGGSYSAGAGGSDGGNGGGSDPGVGQITTTREFEILTGTLYSGGGGASSGGTGGAGGGGKGSTSGGVAGTAGTANTGGGGGSTPSGDSYGGKGGSGIVIIRNTRIN